MRIYCIFSLKICQTALEQLNGFEIAGRRVRAGHVIKHTESPTVTSFFHSEEIERSGINLRASGCFQLTTRLTKGAGLRIPLTDRQLTNEWLT